MLLPGSDPAVLIVTGSHQAVPWSSRSRQTGGHGHHAHFSWRKGVGTPKGIVGCTHFSEPQFVCSPQVTAGSSPGLGWVLGTWRPVGALLLFDSLTSPSILSLPPSSSPAPRCSPHQQMCNECDLDPGPWGEGGQGSGGSAVPLFPRGRGGSSPAVSFSASASSRHCWCSASII